MTNVKKEAGEEGDAEHLTFADEALLRGSDDLLVDFDRGWRMFHEFVTDVGLFTTSGRR